MKVTRLHDLSAFFRTPGLTHPAYLQACMYGFGRHVRAAQLRSRRTLVIFVPAVYELPNAAPKPATYDP